MPKATCSIDGCDLPVRSRGWCHAHYMRWYERGDVGSGPIRAWGGNRRCKVEGCENVYDSIGYCAPHRKRVDKYGEPGPAAIKPRVTPPDEVGYDLTHTRLKMKRGKAAEFPCVECGQRAKQWAYDHEDPDERVDPELGLKFSVDLEHYKPMCVLCHLRFDKRMRQANYTSVMN